MPPKAAIYLDANSGAPLRPEVVAALQDLLTPRDVSSGSDEAFHPLLPNPSSIHWHGRKAKRLMAEARESIARSLGVGVDPENLVFTASGTEANQLAVRGVLGPLLGEGARPHWILSPVEHDSNLQLVDWLRSRRGEVSFLPVDPQGRPRVECLAGLWRPGMTRLVSLVWVNNETGVITDVEALSAEVRRLGGLLHLDGAQAWGKLPLSLAEAGADLVSFSAHKIGALAGAGVLWIAPGTRVSPVLPGKQEKGRRGGTENLLGIVALGAASRALEPCAWDARVRESRDALEREILDRIPGSRVHGAGAPRVANTANLGFEGVEGDGLVMALDLAGFSVSSGSACSSGVIEPSHVLLAMGYSRAEAMAAVRISLFERISPETRECFVKALEQAVTRVRKSRPWPASDGSREPDRDEGLEKRIRA